jgi:hypothetical protein
VEVILAVCMRAGKNPGLSIIQYNLVSVRPFTIVLYRKVK